MVAQPISDLVQAIAKWGKARGTAIRQAYLQEGDWAAWAQVELALQFINTYSNVRVLRGQQVHPDPKVVADLLVSRQTGKKIAIALSCELLADTQKERGGSLEPNAPEPVNGPLEGDAVVDPTCEKTLENYKAMLNVDLSQYNPVVMGIMVSNLANDAARFYLCDFTGFAFQALSSDKAGNVIGLYYKAL